MRPNFRSSDAAAAFAGAGKLLAGVSTPLEAFGLRRGKTDPSRDLGFRITGAAGFGAERAELAASSCDGGRHLRTGLGVFKTRSIGKIPACSDFSIIAHG